MKKTLTFSLENIEEFADEGKDIYEQAKKSRFATVKIRLFGTGENAHTEPVDMETLKRSADSAYDIPLIAELNPYRGEKDFGGHGVLTGKQFSFGFIKESKENPIVFETDEKTGKTFITLYALIWKKYFKNIVDILLNNDNKTEVSVELEELQGKVAPNGRMILHQFVLNAVTFLGKVTTAACQGAMAELCFSADTDSEAFALEKEKYLKNDLNFTAEIGKEKAMETEEKVVTEGTTEIVESKTTETEIKEEKEPIENTVVEEEATENETNSSNEVVESSESKEVVLEKKDVDKKDEDKKDDKEDKDKDENKDEKETKDKKMSYEELETVNAKLSKENEDYRAQIAEMADYEDLKKFKFDTIQKETEMQEMAKMNELMESLENKGVQMSEEVKSDLIKARKDYQNVSAWSNYVKAYVFDNCKTSIQKEADEIVKMDIVKPVIKTEESDNVWARLKTN